MHKMVLIVIASQVPPSSLPGRSSVHLSGTQVTAYEQASNYLNASIFISLTLRSWTADSVLEIKSHPGLQHPNLKLNWGLHISPHTSSAFGFSCLISSPLQDSIKIKSKTDGGNYGRVFSNS